MDSATVTQFKALFAGRTDAWGAVTGGCVWEDVTPARYRAHLLGRTSLGIYPLQDDGTVRWACADLDTAAKGQGDAESDARALASARAVRAQLARLGLVRGVWLERSKSRGAHVWTFFDAPVQAYDARRLLLAALAGAGLSAEVFPKQDRLPTGGVGNYVNLPYFGDDGERRVMLDWDTGAPITLTDFLAQADPSPAGELPLLMQATPAAPTSSRVVLGRVTAGTAGPTPCYHAMLSAGAAEGERNNTAAALVMHLNRQGVSEGQAEGTLLAWNGRNSPPLPEREIRATVRSVYSRGYRALWCEHPVVARHCSPTCAVYQKGVAARIADGRPAAPAAAPAHDEPTAGDDELRLERLTIITDEPRHYRLTVNGRVLDTLATADLLTFPRFKAACFERLDWLPALPPMKGVSQQARWEDLLRPLLAAVTREDIPAETTATGMLESVLLAFLTANTTLLSEDRADLLRGCIWPDGQHYYFRMADLTALAIEKGYDRTTVGAELWALIKRRGGHSHLVKLPPGNRPAVVRVVRYPVTAVTPAEDDALPEISRQSGENEGTVTR